MARTGRPTIYTEKLADEICDAIASSSLGLAHLCDQNPHWPARQHIFIWLRKYPDFYDKYAKAKENQVEVSVDYMNELMNEPHKYVDENGQNRVDVGMIRTKMDAIKWQAGKLKRKKYGDDIKEVESINILSQSAMEHEKQVENDYKKDH